GIEPVYTEANSVDDILDTIDVFGSLLDKEDDADEITASITEYVDEAKSSEQGDVKTLLVYGAPGTYLAALPNSLSGDLLEKSGGVNIAADFQQKRIIHNMLVLAQRKLLKQILK